MFVKRIALIIIMLISLIHISFASSEIYLDYNNYCAGLETTYQIWNKTQWEQRDEIDKEDIEYITDADIRIHSGPLEGMELLFEGSPNATGEFKVTYPESNQYLTFVEYTGNNNFTNFEERIFIEDCKFANGDSSQVEDEELLENTSFIFESIEVELFETTIDEEEIGVSSRDEREFESTNLPTNTFSIYEIEVNSNEDYSSLGITFSPNTPTEYSIYEFNANTNRWNAIEENLNSEYFLSNAETGIYAIAEFEEIQEDTTAEDINSQNSESEEETQETAAPLPQVTKESDGNLGLIIAGVIFGLFVIASPFLFKSKKKKIDDHIISQSLSSYSQEYEKTKQYVLQYKDQFDQKSIRQALIEGDVPIDIVDKVINEVYL